MTIREPDCVMWKRMGAEQVMRQLTGLTREQELEFWQIRTAELRKNQENARRKIKNQ